MSLDAYINISFIVLSFKIPGKRTSNALHMNPLLFPFILGEYHYTIIPFSASTLAMTIRFKVIFFFLCLTCPKDIK